MCASTAPGGSAQKPFQRLVRSAQRSILIALLEPTTPSDRHDPMNPTITMNLLTNEALTDHRLNDALRHQRRAPQIACELVSQAGTPDYRADQRGAAGTAQQRGQA
jgi:hypothetical protein